MFDKPQEYEINVNEINNNAQKENSTSYTTEFEETSEPAPISNNDDGLEIEKLLLNKCYFYYKSDKNEFYKVTIGKDIEISYKKVKKMVKKIDDRFKNNYHYNFLNLLEYAQNILGELKSENKNKIIFELILIFQKIENTDKNANQQISCKFKFFYHDKYENYSIKKKFENKNIFVNYSITYRILKEIKEILSQIKLKDEEKDDNKIMQKIFRKINKLDGTKFNIISFKKIIFKHNISVQMIKELDCGKFVSCGLDGLIVLYDENMNEIDKIKIIDNWIHSISEIPGTKNEFMACCPEIISLISVKDNTLELENRRLNIKDSLNVYAFPTREDEIILCGNKAISKYNVVLKDIKKEIKNNSIQTLNYLHTTSGKRIAENIIAVVSNDILNNGENVLKYINTKNKNEIIEEKKSFNINPNSLLIVNTNIKIQSNNFEEVKRKSKRKKKGKKEIIENNLKNENAILLLCACTKYKNEEKNGILIVCPNGTKIENNFYDTGDFEVFCFCLISNDGNNNNENRDFIFVGGYNNNENRGLIKLYEIIYDNNSKIELTKLRFKRNIDNIPKIKDPINCIIQSSKTGEIVVTSWDGTITLFSKPSLIDK